VSVVPPGWPARDAAAILRGDPDRAPAAVTAGAPAPTTALPQFVRSRYWSSSLSVPRMKNVSGSIVTS